MRWGVVTFPGSLDDRDTVYAIEHAVGDPVVSLWHKDRDLHDVDCIVLPGGFSYGDYLRPGAMARFSPVMESVIDFAASGGLVMGLCNGFQILCEAGLLPGALINNRSLHFYCNRAHIRIEENDTPFTSMCTRGEVLSLPIKHGQGCYVASEETIRLLEENRQVIARYVDPAGRVTDAANPNGSMKNIAGIVNEGRNVFGMMPHAEHGCERLLGGEDGLKIFRSLKSAAIGGAQRQHAAVPPGL